MPARSDGSPAPGVRRRVVVGLTLVVGTTLLGATLATPRGSTAFTVLGFLAAAAWLVGGLSSGPLPLAARPGGPGRAITGPVVVGVAAFGAFVAAERVVRHLPVLGDAVESVLRRADAGPLGVALTVALVNAVAEEVFFRGALPAALPVRRGPVVATLTYIAVTVATLNVALVVAAVVMGTVLMLERLSTGALAAPVVTHVTWSTLMVLALPRAGA